MYVTLIHFLKIAGLIAGFLGSFVLSYIILTELLGAPPLLAGMIVFGLFLTQFWIIAAYVRYRIARQEELLQVLRSAVASQVSLEPAVRAYLTDRPSHASGPTFLVVLTLLFSPIFPGALLLMLWYYWNRFDRKVEKFREYLYDGLPVSDALALVPGVLSSEARLDIRVGTETHRLALALHHAERERLAGAWLELLPRVLYPLMVLLVLFGVQTFSLVSMAPRFKRIFDEFGMDLPRISRQFIDFGEWLEVLALPVALLKICGITLIILLIINPTVRWHTPLVKRFYRRDMQGRVLRNLSLLFEAEAPARDSLEFLADSPELPRVVQTRLAKAATASDAGQSLSEALAANGLLPASGKALLAAAEMTNTLPWALRELGDHLSRQALQSVRRATLVLSPIVLMVLGVFVAFTCIALFLPLVELMIGLSE